MKARVFIAKRDGTSAAFVRLAAIQAGLTGEFLFRQSARDTLQDLSEQAADILILGLTFPDMDGLALTGLVVRRRLARRILVVSMRCDEMVRAQLRPGMVNGFFDPGSEDPAALSTAIGRVADGGTFFSASFRAAARRCTLDQILTPHQIRIFAVLCTTASERDAAVELGLSMHTVHGHLQRIKRKLGVRKMSQLTIEAVRRGVVRVTAEEILRVGFVGAA